MSLILCIETTSKNCSVALCENGNLLGIKELEEEGYTHAENLSAFINEVLLNQSKVYKDLNAIAISEGPGSYTGLRIGAATAKGLCYSLDIPLIAINTLDMMAEIMQSNSIKADYYCPMIDARRMEVFTAVYDNKLERIEEPQAKILDENSYNNYINIGSVLFAGSGAFKLGEIVGHENAFFADQFSLSAKYLIHQAEKKFKKNEFEDIAYFEPFYLKKFQATIPKEKLKTS